MSAATACRRAPVALPAQRSLFHPLRAPPLRTVPARHASVAPRPACTAAPLPGPSLLQEAGRLAARPTAATATAAVAQKVRVVVLGSGWGAVSFLRNLDPKAFGENGMYELVLVSPRDYFLFTPLLPGAMAGTVEEASLKSPIRDLIQGKGTYFQATCMDINPQTKTLTCKRVNMSGEVTPMTKGNSRSASQEEDTFQLPYDVLLLSVGAVNNMFGIKGVADHCWFMKTADDAHRLRRHINSCIEEAGHPSAAPEQRRKLLNFVVVGGGPTGVEVAAELHDLVTEDVARLYPYIKDEVSITVVDGLDKVLSTFNESISRYAGKLLKREGAVLKLGTIVKSVEPDAVYVETREDLKERIPYGTCIWATGIGPHPLVNSLRKRLGEQAQGNPRGLVVDPCLRVHGAPGIVALGDAAVTNQSRAAEHAAQLFEEGDVDQDGRLSRKELTRLFTLAKSKFPQLGDLALQLDWGLHGIIGRLLFPSPTSAKVVAKHRAEMEQGMTLAEFTQMMAEADRNTRPLPPTAQVARQQGEYLASIFSRKLVNKKGAESAEAQLVYSKGVSPFMYIHLGSLAYLGMNRAVMQLPSAFPVSSLKGWVAAHVWRALELYMQVSANKQLEISQDWMRVRFHGRKIREVK